MGSAAACEGCSLAFEAGAAEGEAGAKVVLSEGSESEEIVLSDGGESGEEGDADEGGGIRVGGTRSGELEEGERKAARLGEASAGW